MNEQDRELIIAIRNVIARYLTRQDQDTPFFKFEDLYYELLGPLYDLERDYKAEGSAAMLLAFGYIATLKDAPADCIIASMRAMVASLDANMAIGETS